MLYTCKCSTFNSRLSFYSNVYIKSFTYGWWQIILMEDILLTGGMSLSFILDSAFVFVLNGSFFPENNVS